MWPGTVAVVTKVLVTGMSGTGKSSALVELGKRGFRVVDTDNPGRKEWVRRRRNRTASGFGSRNA